MWIWRVARSALVIDGLYLCCAQLEQKTELMLMYVVSMYEHTCM